jgi:UDP-glucuronate 4-epimerase
MQRDFTYIDDIASRLWHVSDRIPLAEPAESGVASVFYEIFIISSNQPVSFLRFMSSIKNATGHEANENRLTMQRGDVPSTFADINDLMKDAGLIPVKRLKMALNFLAEH